MGALLSAPITAIAEEQARSQWLSAASVSMQGWRRTHEDAHIFRWSVASSSSDAKAPQDSACIAVLDGHGGFNAARLACSFLEAVLVQMLGKDKLSDSADEVLRRVFLATDEHLREELAAAVNEDRSGTTAVVALVQRLQPSQYRVHLAHCGDSRAVVCSGRSRDGSSKDFKLVCTEDHKPAREDETARIRAAGGSVQSGALGGPMRVDGTLAVSRSLGDFQYKPENRRPESQKVTAVPQTQTLLCSDGDWLLLACDGVFDVFSNDEVHSFVEERLKACPPDQPIDGGIVLEELLGLCLERGSKDNCTAILVQLLEGMEPKALQRTMLVGGFHDCDAEVRSKYVAFFESQGFDANGQLPGSPEGEIRRGLSNLSKGTASNSPVASRQLVQFNKALQAMKSSRTIQSAWRRSRRGSDDETGVAPNGTNSPTAADHTGAGR